MHGSFCLEDWGDQSICYPRFGCIGEDCVHSMDLRQQERNVAETGDISSQNWRQAAAWIVFVRRGFPSRYSERERDAPGVVWSRLGENGEGRMGAARYGALHGIERGMGIKGKH